MKNIRLALVIAFVFPFAVLAKEKEKQKAGPRYQITKTVTDPALKKTEAVFDFEFVRVQDRETPLKNIEIQYAYNRKSEVIKTDAKAHYSLKTKPGKYWFQFLYNDLHYEVTTDSIAIGPAENVSIKVYFHYAGVPVMAEKPVIYLYPEKTTEVVVRLAVKGDLTFTYPAYQDGWSVLAQPDGTLKQGDKSFGYLFWEADMPVLQAKAAQVSSTVVEQHNLLAYLENTLAQAGLNSRETQDFITYWYPRMMMYEQTSISFLLNEEMSPYAQLDISPKPDQVLRVFMLWSPGEGMNAGKSTPQVFPAVERKGFTVVEWGGMQVDENLLVKH